MLINQPNQKHSDEWGVVQRQKTDDTLIVLNNKIKVFHVKQPVDYGRNSLVWGEMTLKRAGQI